MVIRRADDKRWVVASYDDEGVHQGFATGRDTAMFWSLNGAAFADKSVAESLCARMERIWPSRIWVVEPAPKVPIDARTGLPLPAEVVRKRGIDAAVAEGFALEVERDERFGKAHRTERNKPAPVLDTARPHALASVLRRQVDSAGGAGIEQADVEDDAGNDVEGEQRMVLVKDGKKATAKKTATKAKAKATTKVPKMQLRTTASARTSAASKRAAAESNGGGPCLCGCGAQTRKWLLRGHVKRVFSQLAAIKAGTTTPEKEFGKSIAAAYGPWKKLASGGQKPATLDFDRVRANV